MYNKVQFTVKDLNTMYAAGILHTRESLGFDKNFKKAGVENPIDNPGASTENKKSLVGENAALAPLLEDLLGKLKGSGGNSKSSGTEGDASTSSKSTTDAASSPVSTSGKASSGTADKAKDWSKVAGGVGGLIGGPVGTLLGLGIGKLAESYQNGANQEEALNQQKAMDNLIGNIQNKETTLDSLLASIQERPTIDYSGGSTTEYSGYNGDSLSNSESRSNSQGF
jgi:hypothetical protein